MSTVFNGEYRDFSTGAGSNTLTNVVIESDIPNDLDGTDSGKVYYIKSNDTLIMEIPNTPYYQVLAGGVLGWSYDFNIITGDDSLGSTDNEFALFSTIGLNEDEGYNNVDLYKNGILMENSPTGDYTIAVEGENYKIVFNSDVNSDDRLVTVISARPTMNNYVTKFRLKEFLGNIDMDILPKESNIYNMGSESLSFKNFYIENINGPESGSLKINGNIEINGDLRVGGTEHTATDTFISDQHLILHYSDYGVDADSSVTIRRAPTVTGEKESTEIVFPADNDGNLDGTYWLLYNATDEMSYYVWYYINPAPAEVIGTNDMSSGYDFSSDNRTLSINGNTYNFNSNMSNITEIVNFLNSQFLSYVEAFDDAGYLGIRTTNVGYSQSFVVDEGTANSIFGISAETYQGVGELNPVDVDPSPTGIETGIQISINKNDQTNTVAFETREKIKLLSSFNTSISGSRVTITNTNIGYSTDVTDVSTGVSVTKLVEGTGTPIHGDRDSKIFWNDTTHRWQLVYGESGNITSNIVTENNGNAPSATKLLNSRTFSITGDGTASNVSFDGTGNVVLDLDVHNDTHDHINGISGYSTRLRDARDIALGGDIAGNHLFDGANNITISSTVNSIQGVDFHQDSVTPQGTTRLNMNGYFYATRVYNAVYNDLAEFMPKAEDAEAGEVMVQTKDGLIRSQKRADIRVVGVYSDSFGYALGAEDAENKIPIGISGTVWVKIEGNFKIGDMVVSYKDGKAIRANIFEKIFKRDALIGKILKDNKENDRVKILIKN